MPGHVFYYNFGKGDMCSFILAVNAQYEIVFAQLGNDLNRLLQTAKLEFKKKGYTLLYKDDTRLSKVVDCYGKLLHADTHKFHSVIQVEDPLQLPIQYIFGTPLQREVWCQLRLIPVGETISYSELARRVGRPTAMRPVASACNANNIAILVPCHRVVGKNGKLTGFKCGLNIKEKLVNSENIIRSV